MANLIDGNAKGMVEVDVCAFLPDPLLKLLASDDLAGPLNQFGQDLKGCLFIFIQKPAHHTFSSREVRFKRTKSNSNGI
jgi:hypothetical protein